MATGSAPAPMFIAGYSVQRRVARIPNTRACRLGLALVFPAAPSVKAQKETVSPLSCAPYPLLTAGRELPLGWRWASLFTRLGQRWRVVIGHIQPAAYSPGAGWLWWHTAGGPAPLIAEARGANRSWWGLPWKGFPDAPREKGIQ